MFRIAKSVLLPFGAVLLLAAEPSWKTKDISQWNEQEARLLLTESPWVKKATPVLLPPQNESLRRQGGSWGGGQSVGTEALSPSSLIGGAPEPGKRRAKPNHMDAVEVRWESAHAVRAAEQKAHDTDAPDWEGNFYVITVYDVPGLDITSKALANNLKRGSSLQSDGRKALRPVRVDLLPQVGGLATVVYLFPRSTEFTTDDKRIEFVALFGQLSMAQYFYPQEMQ